MKVTHPKFQAKMNELLALGHKIITDTFAITIHSMENTPELHTSDLPEQLSDDEILEFALACIGYMAESQPMVLPGTLAKLFTMLAAPEDEEIDVDDFMQYSSIPQPRIVKVPYTVIPGETFERSVERLVMNNPGMPELMTEQLRRLKGMYVYAQKEYASNNTTIHTMLDRWKDAGSSLPLVDETYEQYVERVAVEDNILISMANDNPEFLPQHRMMMEGIRDGIKAGAFSEEELKPRAIREAPNHVVEALKATFDRYGILSDTEEIENRMKQISPAAARWIHECTPQEFDLLLGKAFPRTLH